MRMSIIPVIAATLLAVPSPVMAAPAAPSLATAKPFAMRGVELGITLEEFRAIPVPADGKSGTQVYCSNDVLPKGLHYWQSTPPEMGYIVSCEWFALYPPSGLTNHFIDLGSGTGIPTFRFIIANGAWRLFQISVKANNQFYPAILDALKRNYGEGKSIIEPFQTQAGQTYDNMITRWTNPVSSITLEQRYQHLERYLLTYQHSEYGKIMDAIIEKNRAAAAGKI
ncbi:hypothetical protein GGR43_004112 [Sphingobium jiangsuense]|uniref:Uncharacterized protein n=1 Tax=Sphingobium jiangsuense TaxID=870476 RepID=A0A7W6BK63_9SPHN|nr:hypothetical protein [Sphingobium jiangsuense]MBB3928368.1 hypothetical protein [Sphingobium jiangsuense]